MRSILWIHRTSELRTKQLKQTLARGQEARKLARKLKHSSLTCSLQLVVLMSLNSLLACLYYTVTMTFVVETTTG